MSTSTSPSVRCPRCSAHVRAGSDWCTLCYADLRPAPPPPPPPAVEEAPAPPVELPQEFVAAPQESEEPTPPTRRGKHARRDPAYGGEGALPAPASATPTTDVERLADQLLAELAAAETKNPLGPVAAAVDTTGKRAALMVGGAVAAMCLLFLLMAAMGALL